MLLFPVDDVDIFRPHRTDDTHRRRRRRRRDYDEVKTSCVYVSGERCPSELNGWEENLEFREHAVGWRICGSGRLSSMRQRFWKWCGDRNEQICDKCQSTVIGSDGMEGKLGAGVLLFCDDDGVGVVMGADLRCSE